MLTDTSIHRIFLNFDWCLFRANLENWRFLGLAYPPNKIQEKNAHGYKYPSHFSFGFCLALNRYKDYIKSLDKLQEKAYTE